jgi:hypothetical protein
MPAPREEEDIRLEDKDHVNFMMKILCPVGPVDALKHPGRRCRPCHVCGHELLVRENRKDIFASDVKDHFKTCCSTPAHTFSTLKKLVAERRDKALAPIRHVRPPIVPSTPSIKSHFFSPEPAASTTRDPGTTTTSASASTIPAAPGPLNRNSPFVQGTLQAVAIFHASQGLSYNHLDITQSIDFAMVLKRCSNNQFPLELLNPHSIKSATAELAQKVVQDIASILGAAETVTMSIDNASSGTMKVSVITARCAVVGAETIRVIDMPLAYIFPTEYMEAFQPFSIDASFLADCLTQVALKFGIFGKIIGGSTDRGTDFYGMRTFLSRVRNGKQSLSIDPKHEKYSLQFLAPDLEKLTPLPSHTEAPFTPSCAVQDSCHAHFLNTCLSGAMELVPVIKQILGEGGTIANICTILNSPTNDTHLKLACPNLALEYFKIGMPVSSRWNSVADPLSRILDLSPALEALAYGIWADPDNGVEEREPVITDLTEPLTFVQNNEPMLRKLSKLLSDIDIAFKRLQSDAIDAIGSLPRTVQVIWKAIQAEDNEPAVQNVQPRKGPKHAPQTTKDDPLVAFNNFRQALSARILRSSDDPSSKDSWRGAWQKIIDLNKKETSHVFKLGSSDDRHIAFVYTVTFLSPKHHRRAKKLFNEAIIISVFSSVFDTSVRNPGLGPSHQAVRGENFDSDTDDEDRISGKGKNSCVSLHAEYLQYLMLAPDAVHMDADEFWASNTTLPNLKRLFLALCALPLGTAFTERSIKAVKFVRDGRENADMKTIAAQCFVKWARTVRLLGDEELHLAADVRNHFATRKRERPNWCSRKNPAIIEQEKNIEQEKVQEMNKRKEKGKEKKQDEDYESSGTRERNTFQKIHSIPRSERRSNK